MRRTGVFAVAAVGLTASLALSACGGGSSGGGASSGSSSGSSKAAQNAANEAIVNPSTKTGGELKYLLSDAPDSMDPGNTYYAYNWNFTRLYARPLMTFDNKAGKDGLKLVPDLAEAAGTASADGKTWTYKLKKGITYEDGTPVTSKDVKYAVARSNYSAELTDGPKYFAQYLDAPDYKGPYVDPNLADFKGIDTPDDQTIVFHLTQAFSEFDYLVSNPQTAPVPQAKDTGLKYEEHPVSTGPYMFQSNEVGKGFTLVKNPKWSAATDKTRKQLVDTISLQEKVDANDVDQRLLSGAGQVDLAGTGVQAQARATVLQDNTKKAQTDNPVTGFLRYAMIDTTVPPFDNADCRKAVLYAADHETLQAAFGGSVGGDIATTVIPPNVVGYKKADMYGFLKDKNGNATKAKDSLTKCGKPDGFETNIAVRGDRPKEVAAAEALQQALQKVNIKTNIQKFPAGDWSAQYGGNPKFVKANNLGILFAGWGADWPSGFGFLSQIVDGRAIKPTGGNYNQMELNDPDINALLDKGIQTTNDTERDAIWAQIDEKVMASGAILPYVYEKALLYRDPKLTNVTVTPAYGMYDYTQLGWS